MSARVLTLTEGADQTTASYSKRLDKQWIEKVIVDKDLRRNDAEFEYLVAFTMRDLNT
jgi:hypothetical protein